MVTPFARYMNRRRMISLPLDDPVDGSPMLLQPSPKSVEEVKAVQVHPGTATILAFIILSSGSLTTTLLTIFLKLAEYHCSGV